MMRQDMRRRDGLATFWAAFLGLCLMGALAVVRVARADDGRSISKVPNRTAYVFDTSIGIDSASEAVDYSPLPGWNATEGAYSVCVQNRLTTDELLFQLVPIGTSVAAAVMTTPVSGTISPVDEIDESDDDWVCYNGGKYAGHKWQGRDSAGNARVRIQY